MSSSAAISDRPTVDTFEVGIAGSEQQRREGAKGTLRKPGGKEGRRRGTISCLHILRGVIAGVLDLGCGSGDRGVRQAGSLRYGRLEICATGLVFGVAVDTFEVGFELVRPGRVFVLLPVVVEVFGGYAGGEAAQARGEVEKPNEVGNAEALLALSLV